jgi:outer membrane scaffolding protein for murein synthesis (MipA/OmpV family)
MAQEAPTAGQGDAGTGLDATFGKQEIKGDGLSGYVAVGVSYAPDYDGSDDYSFYPYIEGRLAYGDFYARLEGLDLRFNVIPSPNWHAGPVVGYRPGRADVEDDRIDRLRAIDDALGAGAFIEFEHVADDPRYAETLTLSVTQDVTGQETGLFATLRGEIRRPVLFINPGFIVSLESEIQYASDDYMETYFSVSPGDAGRSGLPQFDADAGFKDVGVGLSIDQFLSPYWSVGTRLHYFRMLEDAGDSPVTDDAGSRNQFFAALITGFRF